MHPYFFPQYNVEKGPDNYTAENVLNHNFSVKEVWRRLWRRLISHHFIRGVRVRCRVIVLNVTFNNISWWSVLLVEETEVPRENHWPVTSHWQTLSHNVGCIQYTSPWTGFKLTTLVVIGTDCIGSYKSNWHTITATTAPYQEGTTRGSS